MKSTLALSLNIVLSTLFVANTVQANARKYDPAQHFYKSDESTGYNIGMSLYQLKNTEMQAIVKKVVDEVNALSAQEVFKYSTKNNIFKAEGDLRLIVKTHKIEKLIEARNMALIKKMNELPLPKLTAEQRKTRAVTVTDQQLIDTSISINYSPATDANPELKQKYDPEGNYGLCFLRSHYYANEAGLRGLVKESIKKVFAVGTMMPLGYIPFGTWQFHVAAAVRGEGGIWKALDNHLSDYQEEAFSITDWYNHYNKWLDAPATYQVVNAYGQTEELKIKSLFLYFTDPTKMGPSSNAYNAEAFYGVDTNGNGKLEGKEIFYNSAFQDVDKHLMNTRPGVCDPDRYQPLSSSDARCSSPANIKRAEKRSQIIQYWRQEWKRAKGK